MKKGKKNSFASKKDDALEPFLLQIPAVASFEFSMKS
jgi:hypothetical protein